jgi:hypothetical protein
MKPRKVEEISLPVLVRKQSSHENFGHRELAQYDEGAAIVGTASGKLLSEEINKQLPESWNQQRLDELGNHLSKGDWENEIARHVLSLFASTQARTNLHEGTVLLDFIDHKKAQTNESEYVKSAEADNSNRLEDIHSSRKKNKSARKIKKEKERPAEEQIDADTKAVVHKVFKLLEKDPLNESKYRTNNTIRVKDGQEIVVRGSPRCYPIWFASTGDVYSNWEQLPGGRELQAQLNVLYEHQKFSEYLDVLETTLEKLWREIRYGKEEFDIGSFGNSSKGLFKVDYSTIKTKKGKSSKFGKSQSIKSEDYGEFSVSNSHLNSAAFAPTLSANDICVLWCQLINTANAMGVMTIEKKQYELSLALFDRAEKWSQRKDIITNKAQRTELKAYIRDSIAYLFFKRAGYVAALAYCQEALEDFEKSGNVEAVAGCLSHQASVLVFRGDFKEAHKV